METQKPEFGFNVIGYITANLGQGVAARNTVRRLVNCGYKVSCVDLDPGYGRSNQDKTFEHLIAPDNAPAPYSINIFHMNPPEYRIFMRHFPHMFRFRDRINVCVPFWELNRIPQSWVQPLELMDVVLAPTEFIKHAVASSVSDVSIRKLTSAAYLPEFEKTTRDKYGINNDSVAFVTSFDVTSEAARKNPWAAIQAFNESFSQKDNVNLIIKINGQNYDGFEKVRDQLNELKTRNKKIILIDAKMSYPEVISLYACCDVFVSLHRGEGLGLGLMEAMLLGKPVIGTAYSGNMDFMDDSNSCLVNYKLIQIPEKNVNHYSKEALGTTLFWADPDLNEASAWMKRLAKSRILREEIGQKAKSTQIQRQNDNSVFNTLIEISNNHKERLSESRKRYCLKSGSKKMRILFQNRPCAYRVPGGDTVVMNRLQEILQKTGMQIDFSSDYHPDLSDYDLVHIFNLTVPHYTEAFAKNAINAGVPYVVTTLQEDFRKYQIKANFATRLFWMYRDKKQLPQIFEMGLAELLTLPEARDTTSLIAGTFAEALLACGASEGKTLNRLFPNTAIEIAPFGCSVKDIDVGPELFERKYGVKDFILCVGRMESRKNQLMLLKALEFDDIPIVFCIGATHEKSEYMRLCREFKRKGKTIFAEKLSDEMLVSAYRAAKVHCLPSWFELPGLVTLEAAYYGCNAVASNWGSIGDYATTDDCWFISPDDPNGMRTVLLDAMMAPRSSKSSNKIKDFSWERSAKTVTNIYNKVVGDFKTRNMHSFLEISNEPRPTPSMSSFFGSILEEIDNKNFAEAIKTYKNGKVNYPPCEELDKFDTLMIKLSGKLGGQS